MDSRRRVAVSIALVALVALAGCTSGSLGEVLGDDSEAKSLDAISLPDGASGEAVENGTALANAHADQLADRGYEVEVSATYASGSEAGNVSFVVRRDAQTGELYQRSIRMSGDSEQRTVAYANESATYQKQGTEDPSYHVTTDQTSDDEAVNAVVRAAGDLVRLGNWSDPRVVSVDGATLVEYDLTGVSSDVEFVETDSVTNASGSLLVDEAGVVHSVTVDLTRAPNASTSDARYEYRVTALGDVAVQQPDWVSEAASQHEAASRQAANRVDVVAATGVVSDGRVDTVSVVVARPAGAEDVDLSAATVEWTGPEAAATLTLGDSATAETFAVEAVRDSDDSAPVLNARGDRLKLVLDASEVGGGLAPGADAKLIITTQSGAATTYRVSVPGDLSGESVVRV